MQRQDRQAQGQTSRPGSCRPWLALRLVGESASEMCSRRPGGSDDASRSERSTGRRSSGVRMGQSRQSQQLILALAHPLCVGVVVVVKAAEMQESVNDVKSQLSRRLDADLARSGARHLGGDHQLAGQDRVVGRGRGES